MLTRMGSRRTEKQPTGRGPEGCDENGPARGKRIGESACRRLQSVINFVETSWSLQPCRKAVFPDADTPIRQYADPPTRFPSRRLILNATTSSLYARRYTMCRPTSSI